MRSPIHSITDSMDMTLSKLRAMVKEGKPGMFQSTGLERVGHNLASEWEQQQSRDLFTIALHSNHHCKQWKLKSNLHHSSNCVLQLKTLSSKVKELTYNKVTKPNEKMKNHIQIQGNTLKRNEWNKVYMLERMIACRIQLARWGLGDGSGDIERQNMQTRKDVFRLMFFFILWNSEQ